VKLRLAYLYGDLMNLYGDRGNIITLQRRCEWRGIELDVVEHSVGDQLDPQSVDLFFFGGGQDREQETVGADLVAGAGDAIREAVEQGAALLSVCGGYQLLGRFFRTSAGAEIPGAGLFDAYTVAGAQRRVGNVVANATLDGQTYQLVGFENHSGQTHLGTPPSPSTVPLAHVLVGNGNNGGDKLEGARYRGAIGTYLHGPVLPKNPWLADWLIAIALRRRFGSGADLPPLPDAAELAASSAFSTRVLRSGNVRTSIR
jgi:CobQ-like glutamine amidotransferase family enzyme